MENTYRCGHVRGDLFLDAAQRTSCAGKLGGCPKPVVAFVLTFEPVEEGSSDPSILTLAAACRKHLEPVRRQRRQSGAARWLGGDINPAELGALIDWFHGESGLCAHDRAIRLVTPGLIDNRAL